jgi:hypothetical protein
MPGQAPLKCIKGAPSQSIKLCLLVVANQKLFIRQILFAKLSSKRQNYNRLMSAIGTKKLTDIKNGYLVSRSIWPNCLDFAC